MASGKASKKKRAQAPVQAPMRRKDSRSGDHRLWVAAAVAAVLVLAAVAATLLTRGEEGGGAAAGATLPEASEIASLFRGIPQTGTTLGRPDAPVTLVEFLDMQCPFCRQFETEVVPTLAGDHVRGGRLRLETRGLAFIGPDSERGLRAVLAAGLQGRLYELRALLYANQGSENAGWLSEDLVEAAARSIPGLDVPRLLRDMESAEVSDLISQHADEAGRRGVNSTPTVLVGPTGGELRLVQMESAGDLAAVEAAIEAAAG